MTNINGTRDRIVNTDPSSGSGGGGSVTIDGQPINVDVLTTPGLTETQLRTVVPDEEGVWDYVAGVSGTEIIPAGGRILGIAVSVTASGATVTINGGDAIPIPWITGTVQGVEIAPRANLVAPTIDFFGTAAYLVEFIT